MNRIKSLFFLFFIFFLISSFSTNFIYGKPNIWLSTNVDLVLIDSNIHQWLLEQTVSFPISNSFSLSALFGYSFYYEDTCGYKAMLGGTYIFPKNWYIDLMYGFYFFDYISIHQIFFAINFEKNNWFLSLREVMKFSNDFFATTTYIYSIYTFPNNYTFSINSAVGFEVDKGISYALWMKSFLPFFSFFGSELGASFAVEKSEFNFSIILGFKFYFNYFFVSLFYQPFFAGKKGYSDFGLAFVVKL